jgi:hypothetical protein
MVNIFAFTINVTENRRGNQWRPLTNYRQSRYKINITENRRGNEWIPLTNYRQSRYKTNIAGHLIRNKQTVKQHNTES